MNIFEYAVRNKLRFQSTRGDLTTEMLWDVPLRSKDGFNLNEVAKAAGAKVKSLNEESYVDQSTRTHAHLHADYALEVVKHIIAAKLKAENDAEKRAANKVRKEKLLAILAEKQDGKLSELSERELKKQIAELEDV